MRQVVQRFIPTPVGNARLAGAGIGRWSVHPHARGERGSRCRIECQRFGSSPRPWGTPRAGHALPVQARFIPTPVGNAAPAPRCPASSPVHPHARGERAELHRLDVLATGSSPRPWGTPACEPASRAAVRFIPTPVGNAARASACARCSSVHPHARGERQAPGHGGRTGRGSSPRPWGTQGRDQLGVADARFIPTPVGNASGTPRGWLRRPVHPHARGERHITSLNQTWSTGSSPRPWGTPAAGRAAARLVRFIPTPVGNAFLRRCRSTRGPVHPHARGERSPASASIVVSTGSSPRPWGTPSGVQRHPPTPRFIPTPVGNAPARPRPAPRSAVHPHARGERTQAAGHIIESNGSSPRPWGTLFRVAAQVLPRRFIPTPVGNAASRRPRRHCWSVHPHARGERMVAHQAPSRSAGSSPRPWGTHEAGAQRLAVDRFIPTPVGNARPRASRRPIPSVHPHARGERTFQLQGLNNVNGSSPRPWGTLLAPCQPHVSDRFIPTPVGNAPPRCGSRTSSAVHPHARGERIPLKRGEVAGVGSSPRPWGTPRLSRRRESRLTVHPHARGERPDKDAVHFIHSGSSPRPWGTPNRRSERHDHRRFIPTPVGNAGSHCPSSILSRGSSPRPWGTLRAMPSGSASSSVHPHARGERPSFGAAPAAPPGSSPRPWGTRRHHDSRVG